MRLNMSHSNTRKQQVVAPAVLVVAVTLVLATSMVFLGLAGKAAPWYGWALDAALGLVVISLVIRSKHSRAAAVLLRIGLATGVVASVASIVAAYFRFQRGF